MNIKLKQGNETKLVEDIKILETKCQNAYDEIEVLLMESNHIEIETDGDLDLINDYLINAKAHQDDFLKIISEPLEKSKKRYDFFKDMKKKIKDKFNELKSSIEAKTSPYLLEKEKKRQEALKKQQEEYRKRQEEKLNRDKIYVHPHNDNPTNDEEKNEEEFYNDMVVPDVPGKTVTTSGSVSHTKKLDYEIGNLLIVFRAILNGDLPQNILYEVQLKKTELKNYIAEKGIDKEKLEKLGINTIEKISNTTRTKK